MSDEEKLDKAVEQAVEVAANKAAEDEIDQLTKFENAIDEQGVAQVLPVLDSEPVSHLVEGLEAVGGRANVFVHTADGVVALSVMEYKANEEE